MKKETQKVKKEKNESVNGGVSASTIVEGCDENEEKTTIRKDVHWEPINMSDFEVQGVKDLIERLRTWDRAINNCPSEIADKEQLLDRLEVCYCIFMQFRRLCCLSHENTDQDRYKRMKHFYHIC